MNSHSIQLRTMQHSDIPFADSLRRMAGWNQLPSDWERFLRMEPNGCFIAEMQNNPAGTATTIIYEDKVAWIGMVLVHPEQRRKGVGRALLLKCIEYLQGLGIPSIKLDATPEGKLVYEKLGFKPEWNLSRWERSSDPAIKANTLPSSKKDPFSNSDLITLDREAFGVSRKQLLTEIAAQNDSMVTAPVIAGNTTGFGFLREGDIAKQIGPVVASSKYDFDRIIANLIGEPLRDRSTRFFWDIPDQNQTASTWAKKNGFKIQRTLTRMYLESNNTPGNPLMQYAITSPELG